MIVILGKTGSGKTTLVNNLIEKGYEKCITDTTRPIRKGEVDGVDYHFLTPEVFEENLQKGLYAEHVLYKASFGDAYYGSRLSYYEDDSKNTIIILNPYGFKMVNDLVVSDNRLSIYLNLDDDLLLKRLEKRGDSKEEVQRRLGTDCQDFSDIHLYCDYVINVTDETTVEELADIVHKLNTGQFVEVMYQVKSSFCEINHHLFNTEDEAKRYCAQCEIESCRELYPELADSQYAKESKELTENEIDELLENSLFKIVKVVTKKG